MLQRRCECDPCALGKIGVTFGSYPKNSMIAWMAILDRLPTRNRLIPFGSNIDGCVETGFELEAGAQLGLQKCQGKISVVDGVRRGESDLIGFLKEMVQWKLAALLEDRRLNLNQSFFSLQQISILTKTLKSSTPSSLKRRTPTMTRKIREDIDEFRTRSQKEKKRVFSGAKAKEMETMNVSNANHVLNVEEVLHYYSCLTCPAYVVDKFFMEICSAFLGVKKEAVEILKRTTSFSGRKLKSAGEEDFTLAHSPLTPTLHPSSPDKKTNNRKKAKASTEKKLKLKKSQSETIIKPAVTDSGGMKISSMKNNAGDGRCTPEIKSPAMICAEEVQSNLEPEFPSFAKSLVRSHVGSCFWMGLPGVFCRMHLPRKDTAVTLEDEGGHQYCVKYYADKTGLSAGWRQFCSANNLLEGDVLVFHSDLSLEFNTKKKVLGGMEREIDLVPANYASTLKVPIGTVVNRITLDCINLRGCDASGFFQCLKRGYVSLECMANDLNELDGALGLLNLDAHTKQSDAGKLIGTFLASKSKKRKCPKPLPLASVRKKNKSSGLQGLSCNIGQPAVQSENDSEEVGSEVLEDFKRNVPTSQFKGITSFENNILVDGLVVDPKLSEDIRSKYYQLCCSQNAFLHENIIQGISFKFKVGIISETVRIADAIRGCKLTTSRDEFDRWDKTLKAFELLGVNVGFLRTRLQHLVNLAFESEGAAEQGDTLKLKQNELRPRMR
ncbi:B3 domain-containing protein [Hibiscus syriacus]|uniref:B3 domain-containing protein n=1 Tax=Hibiscus syriacus TaxID=106335 RepID=A0A6A2ZTV0_HIBSY|nr:B3 domain-containing protein [Hibiscus syriacus]